jgi:pilus assembly protein Flp/PilA
VLLRPSRRVPWHSGCDRAARDAAWRRAHYFNRCGDAANHAPLARCSVREDAMTMLMQYAKSFVNQEEGQDLLEYALLVALIALVAIVAVTAAGESVDTIFTKIADALAGAA